MTSTRDPHTRDPRSSQSSDMLAKVRALLAKAESTTFDAEAESLTAKAQELIARHRLDQALVEAERGRPVDEPGQRTIRIDPPYAEPKALLLSVVAQANGAEAVWAAHHQTVTVFGQPDELDAIEALFTSLLVQATSAMAREGSKRDARGRNRTKRFRRSFLVAYASRIGDRLQHAVDETVADAESETGSALVPVLAARHEAARAAATEAFPGTRRRAPRVSDGEGWFSGTAAGDRADLATDPTLAGR